jgi:hypothetical protein
MIEPTTYDWRGVLRYSCPLCAFDTGDQETARDHILWRHRLETKPAPVVADPAPAKAKRKPEPEPVVEEPSFGERIAALETGE